MKGRCGVGDDDGRRDGSGRFVGCLAADREKEDSDIGVVCKPWPMAHPLRRAAVLRRPKSCWLLLGGMMVVEFGWLRRSLKKRLHRVLR